MLRGGSTSDEDTASKQQPQESIPKDKWERQQISVRFKLLMLQEAAKFCPVKRRLTPDDAEILVQALLYQLSDALEAESKSARRRSYVWP